MIFNNIYKSEYLKYPLIDKEYRHIDDAWKLLKIFKTKYVLLSDYRKHVIKKIKASYSPEEFYFYESILNKLFWNLRWLMYPLWINEHATEKKYEKIIKNNYGNIEKLPYSLLLCKFKKYTDDSLDDIVRQIYKENNYYRSFINKVIIIDKVNKLVISKQMEGSMNIFGKNYFNLLTATILFNRKLYEKVMREPYLIKYYPFIEKLLDTHYYQFDYGFPNLNYCVYEFGTKNDRMKRIKRMYYGHDIRKQSRLWSVLIE